VDRTIVNSLASAASNIGAARAQMAISLGWHIVLACLGVGMPLVILIAEFLGIRTGQAHYTRLAHRWAKTAGVLFAIGAVSGTILSFEMGILWPGLVGTFGAVFGLPFALEGIAFFIEAIFLGIYLYGWKRLTPVQHLLTGIPIVIAGTASAFFVVAANAWMNEPRGFDLVNGKMVNADPWGAMFNPATPVETIHMILAAFMVTGFVMASVYAFAMLRKRDDPYHRAGFAIPFIVAAVCTLPQIVVGDFAARFVAEHQPAKLAAMEALFHTERGVPEHVGGVAINGELRYDLEIPRGLSLLISGTTDSEIVGLDAFPADQRPIVNVVHLAFDTMVGIGFGLLALAIWLATGIRRRRLPRSRWFWRGAVIAGPATVIAMEAGWVVTEVGRQPWIVYKILRTADAVNPAPGLVSGLFILIALYLALTATAAYILRRIAREQPGAAAIPE
jgi:cytochrome d ubiquinol oxidase subunit I